MNNNYLDQLLAEAKNELARADNKANILLAVFSIVIAATLKACLQIIRFPKPCYCIYCLFLSFFIMLAISVCALIWSVFPRFNSSSTTSINYFGDIKNNMSAEEVLDILRSDPREKSYIDAQQLIALSSIVRRKYQLIRFSSALFIVGFIGVVTMLSTVYSGIAL